MLDKKRSEDRRLKLDVIQCYGSSCSQKIRDSVAIIEDDQRKLIYPVGKFIAQKHIDRPEMSFIKLSENNESIACIARSPNNKFLAVAEKLRNEQVPQVSIFNLKSTRIEAEKREFKYSESKSSVFVGLAFSHNDSRFLLCVTGAPDFQLLFLDLVRMKPLATCMIGAEISRISISPKDNHMVGVSGKGYFKILRVQENSFIALTETIKRLPTNQNFTDHCWFEENKVLLTNDKGEIYIINDGAVRERDYINCGFKDLYGMPITCITAFSKGFLIGSDSGYFALWVRADEREKQKTEEDEIQQDIQFLKKWRTERKSAIVSMDISKNEDLVAVAFANNDICTIEMAQVLPTSTEALDSYKNNEKFLRKEVKFDFLFNGFHNGPITHLDVCLQRPLIVTASKYDSTIRIWNYTSQRCELARKFYIGEDGNQQALGSKDNMSAEISPLCSVGFHPSGYYLAAGFIDKLRIYHVLHSELKTYKELVVKNCSQVRFSQGGNMLAAAYPRVKSTHYYINIYDAYTMEFLHTLKGHTNQITELIWGIKDSFIATCGLDGGIYEWNSLDWTRKDYTYNNTKFSSLLYDQPIGVLLAAGTENQKDKGDHEKIETKSIVRELRIMQNGVSQGKDTHLYDLGMQKLSQISFIQSFYNTYGIVGGTENGGLNIYSYIFNSMAFDKMNVHQGEITKIRSSPDGRYLFTTGADGSVFIFQISEMNGDGQVFSLAKDQIEDIGKLNSKAGVVDDNLADVVLVSRNEIESYITEQNKLLNDLQDLDQKTEVKVQEERKRFEKEIDEIKKKFRAELAAKDASYEQLKSQKSSVEKESANLFKNVENNHLRAVEELENLYERKLAFENEKYLQLEQKLMEERMLNQQQIQQFEKKHVSYIELLKNQFKENFMITEKALDNNKSQADKLKQTYEEILAQQEEDHEYEIRQLSDTQKAEVEKLKIEIATQKTNIDNMKTKSNQLRDENDLARKLAVEKQNEIEMLNSKLREAENKIELQAKELEDRDEQLKKKEKKIYEYKYKISDLQKSKHVLSFRTTEMRKQLEPKEDQIIKLKDELFKLESEFQAMLKAQKAIKDKGLEMQSQIDTLTRNLASQTQLTKQKETLIQQITMDIHNTVNLQDEKNWVKEMKNLYQVYVLQQEIKSRQNDPRSNEEMARHVSHLEKSAIQSNMSAEKMMLRKDKEIYKRMNENQALIYELNEIRKLNKDCATDISNKTMELAKYKKENDKLKQENTYLKSRVQKMGGGEVCININQGDIFESVQEDNFAPQQSLLPNPNQKQPTRNSSLPQKGKICRGANYDKNKQQPFEAARSNEIMAQLQLAVQKNLSQESMIRTLRKILKDRNIEDPFHDDMNDSQIGGRPHSQGFGSRL